MSRSVTCKDRQEVAFRPKQKYEERETGWEMGGWKEEGYRGREKEGKEQTQRARRNRRKKNQANWYAAHNNRRVERRGSEVRPARGSCSWREGGINTLSLFLSSSLTRRHVHESERVDTRARTCTRFPRRCVSSCFSYFPSFSPSSVVSMQQLVANPETHVERSERAASEKREKGKVDSLPVRRADGSLESWDSPGRRVTEL